MGRHSAPDDDGDDGSAAVGTAVAPSPRADGSADETTTLPRVTDTDPTLDLGPLHRGRHSSPDDDEGPPPSLDLGPADEQPTQMIASVDLQTLDAADAHAEAETGQLPAVPAPDAAGDASGTGDDLGAKALRRQDKLDRKLDRQARKQADREQRAADKQAQGESDTRADLRLVRTHRSVQLQIVGALLVAFGLYTAVMAVLGRIGDFALWVWIPILVSGVLIGVVLDLAHRRVGRAVTEPVAVAAPEPSRDAVQG